MDSMLSVSSEYIGFFVWLLWALIGVFCALDNRTAVAAIRHHHSNGRGSARRLSVDTVFRQYAHAAVPHLDTCRGILCRYHDVDYRNPDDTFQQKGRISYPNSSLKASATLATS